MRSQPGADTMLSTENISYSVGQKVILSNLSVEFMPNAFHAILGPNGSGKSSFLKIFSGEIHGYGGRVQYEEKDLKKIPKNLLAQRRAVMSQQPELGFPLAVDEVVLMGRYPHFDYNPNRNDLIICDSVMQQMNLLGFSERNYLTLSGGEKQRVQFARVLAQVWEKPAEGCRYLFLDEPLTSLDLKYQVEFLERTKALLDEQTVVIAILHDINLAVQYADRMYFLKEGKLLAQGSPDKFLSRELIEEAYGIRVNLVSHPETGRPMVMLPGEGLKG